MNKLDLKNIDIFVFGFFPGIAIVVISVVLADSFKQGVLLFAICLTAYFAILLLLQEVLLFFPSERKKLKENIQRPQIDHENSQNKEKDTPHPSFSLCLKYPDREEKISKKINDFLLASGNAKNKTFAMIITAAVDAGLIMPVFDRGVVAKKFNMNRTELSRNMHRDWGEKEEQSIENYQKEFMEMKDVFDAAEKSKKQNELHFCYYFSKINTYKKLQSSTCVIICKLNNCTIILISRTLQSMTRANLLPCDDLVLLFH